MQRKKKNAEVMNGEENVRSKLFDVLFQGNFKTATFEKKKIQFQEKHL
jgi:hypothetical protein